MPASGDFIRFAHSGDNCEYHIMTVKEKLSLGNSNSWTDCLMFKVFIYCTHYFK